MKKDSYFSKDLEILNGLLGLSCLVYSQEFITVTTQPIKYQQFTTITQAVLKELKP